MTDFDFDLFVIGAGSGGIRAARVSAALGARVAIAEARYLGGTCVNAGCIPKKLLVYASHYAEEFRNAAGYGWQGREAVFDWRTFLKNKNNEIKRLNSIYKKLLDDSQVTVYKGKATLLDAHTVQVNGRRLRARHILVATGGWPTRPDLPGQERLLSSNEFFHLERLPERVVIIGGGYIAVEFACILHGLGVATTLLYRGELFLRGFDREMRAFLAAQLRRKGIKLLFNTRVERIRKHDDHYRVDSPDTDTLAAGVVVCATGRHPNTAGLGLEKIGVELEDNGAVIVDSGYRSSAPSIYAIGDVTDKLNLTPVAIAEGTELAQRLFGAQPVTPVSYDETPTCIFSQPELATVGLTEEEARRKHTAIHVYRSCFTPLKHTLTGSGEQTLIKLIVERDTDKVVGAHIVGADAGEIIQGIAIAIRAGATKAIFDSTTGIHPTTAEEFVTLRAPAE